MLGNQFYGEHEAITLEYFAVAETYPDCQRMLESYLFRGGWEKRTNFPVSFRETRIEWLHPEIARQLSEEIGERRETALVILYVADEDTPE